MVDNMVIVALGPKVEDRLDRLTPGKSYEVIREWNNYYEIIDR